VRKPHALRQASALTRLSNNSALRPLDDSRHLRSRKSSQVKSSQVKSSQVRSGQVRSGQVRSSHPRSRPSQHAADLRNRPSELPHQTTIPHPQACPPCLSQRRHHCDTPSHPQFSGTSTRGVAGRRTACPAAGHKVTQHSAGRKVTPPPSKATYAATAWARSQTPRANRRQTGSQRVRFQSSQVKRVHSSELGQVDV